VFQVFWVLDNGEIPFGQGVPRLSGHAEPR